MERDYFCSVRYDVQNRDKTALCGKCQISGFLDRSGPATKTAFLQVAEAAMHQRPYIIIRETMHSALIL